MTNDARKKKLFYSGAAGALAGLGLLPATAQAQAVLDVAQALDTPLEPPSDADALAEQVAPGVTVKTRDVAWDVPWIESNTSVARVSEPVAEAQLAVSFAEEAAIAQAAQTTFPLIEVASSPVEIASSPVEAAPVSEDYIIDFEINGVPVEAAETKEVKPVSAVAVVKDEPPLTLVQPDSPLANVSAETALSETGLSETAPAGTGLSETTEYFDAFDTVAPLIAIAPDADEDSDEDEFDDSVLAFSADIKPTETVSPLLAILIPEDESFTDQKRTPLLARALAADDVDSAPNVESAGDLDANPLLALRELAEPQQEEKPSESWLALVDPELEAEANNQREPWLAYAALDDDEDEDNKKAPWLARSSAADNAGQIRQNPAAPRLAINLPRRDANKRPSAWISLTPTELSDPENSDLALNPAANAGAESYDVSNLLQVAITPADLANSDEIAVSVDSSEVEFLSPEAGAFLDIPATSVVLRFPIGANIALLANSQVVDASLVGRTETDPATQLRTQTWYGVPLVSGENILEVISTETGDVLQSLPLSVRGKPERLVLLSPSSIPSDGRSTAAIRGQLVDAVGNISRWDSVATIQASDGRFLGADYDPDLPGYQVEIQRGEFVAELQSSLESHLVQIQAMANGFEAFSQVQFDTPQRPDLVSGVIDVRLGARGTDFYDSYREFLPVDGDNSYEFDIDAAVFATGNLGEWLYTGAYNSDRTLNENCRGETTLFRASTGGDCNTYATYGDDSYSDVVAPSLDSVYLRFERNSPTNETGIDYAMWGDFNTQEFATASQLFTATNRQLHGFKTNYNFGALALTGLYANNVEGFQRDTIAPDGTSGTYFTSQRDLVPGSENVYLEVEELERPGTVLERIQLARGLDYEIDYDRGSLDFNDPVMRTAVDDFGQLLVRRIVTTYQHEDGDDTDIWAGRAQYSLNRKQGQESWVGASYFAQDQGSRDFTLYGADTKIALGESAQITAEIAESTNNFDGTGDVSGSAYRLEVDGSFGSWLNGRAYVRSTDAGFANSATTSFVPGQTRYGTQLSSRLGRTTTVRAQFDHEDNFGTAPRVITDLSELLSGLNTTPGTAVDNSLTTYSVGLSQRLGRANAEVDWIHRDRTDRLNSDTNVSSDQLRTRLSTPIADKLTLVAQNELNLSSNVDPIYPSRTLVGLNWEAMPWLNVGVNQIFYGGGGNSRGNATSIDVTGEHTFASDTTVRGRFSTVDGRQLGGTIGLEQGINLAPGLDLDLGYEKVFSTFGNETAASTQFSQPFATGDTASSLGLAGGESYSIGLSYTDNPDFQARTSFEHRNNPRSSNTVFDISALGRITPSLTLLGDYRLSHAANQNITGLGTTSLLKLGMAYRNPDNDRFNALLRYEHRLNPNSVPTNSTLGASTETQEHVLSAEAIYAPNWRWELYGKYALRNSRTSINASDNSFSSSSTAQLAQARATYRLAYRWDVVGEARWLGGNGYNETGYSVEAGYYPLPDLRVSAGYSGGATDSDFGDNRDGGGFYIGATAKLSGLLNGFGTRPSAPYQQQESVIDVSQELPSQDLLESAAESINAEPAVEGQRSSTTNPYPTATEL
ncbi:MAG: TonB-dependent receptor [Cyanobacteria bacterium P01_F01_bin.3]